MNWTKEQRFALAACSIASGLVSLGIGYSTSRNRYGIIDWLKDSTADAFLWALIGAVVGGAAIFVYRSFSNWDRAGSP
jgi:hypothetical protein